MNGVASCFARHCTRRIRTIPLSTQSSASTLLGNAPSSSPACTSTGMDLVFLGTSSAVPTGSRGTTCLALRYEGDIWLFDTGEGAQRQLQRSIVRPTSVSKIFISHMHGDHVFGLPGLLCLLGLSRQDQSAAGDIIDIYGPEGLREFIYTTIRLTYSTVVPRFRVHELKDIPWRGARSRPSPQQSSRFILQPGSFLKQCDIDESRDIYPDSNGIYHLVTPRDLGNTTVGSDRGIYRAMVSQAKQGDEAPAASEVPAETENLKGGDDGCLIVTAAPMDHTVPCVGYVITELDKQGTLHPERVADIIKRNRVELVGYRGLGRAEHVYKVLKSLEPGGHFKFPDDTVVYAKDILDPPKRGRKVVIMGDTRSGRHIERIAMNPDILVHEATNAWVPGVSNMEDKYDSPKDLERELVKRGHSTADMAGSFAGKVNAKHLVLTHFSARFGGGDSSDEQSIMNVFKRRAFNAASKEMSKPNHNTNEDRKSDSLKGDREAVPEARGQFKVSAATDFLVVNVDIESRNRPEKPRY